MLKANCGHLVYINSVLGYMGLAGAADYCASKHALTGMTEALRDELHDVDGIHITSVHPHMTNTDLFKGCQMR